MRTCLHAAGNEREDGDSFAPSPSPPLFVLCVGGGDGQEARGRRRIA